MARKTLIQVRRDTAANWTSTNPTLAAGEFGYETNTGKVKIGDGSTAWNSLAYLAPSTGSSPLTTKGDLWGYSTGDARVPVGTDGNVLIADSTKPLGVKWGAPGSGSGYTLADYAEVTSASINITATTEGTATSIVSGAGFTADGTSWYLVEFFCPSARPDTGAAGRTLTFVLLEGATVIEGQWALLQTPAAGSDNKPVSLRARLKPAAGSRTYSCAAFINSGTGAVFAGGGGSGTRAPISIMVTKLA